MPQVVLQIRCVSCQKRCDCYFTHCHLFSCHTPGCEYSTSPPNPFDRLLPDGTIMFENNDRDGVYFVYPNLLAEGAIVCILNNREDGCLDVSVERPGGRLDLFILDPWELRPPGMAPVFDGWNWRSSFVPMYELHEHTPYAEKSGKKACGRVRC